MFERSIVVVLVLLAFLPCEGEWDLCAEDGAAQCSEGCHLGCAIAPMPAVGAGLAPAPPFVERHDALTPSFPRPRASRPETPPPRA